MSRYKSTACHFIVEMWRESLGEIWDLVISIRMVRAMKIPKSTFTKTQERHVLAQVGTAVSAWCWAHHVKQKWHLAQTKCHLAVFTFLLSDCGLLTATLLHLWINVSWINVVHTHYWHLMKTQISITPLYWLHPVFPLVKSGNIEGRLQVRAVLMISTQTGLVKHRPLEENNLKLHMLYLKRGLKLNKGISKGVCMCVFWRKDLSLLWLWSQSLLGRGSWVRIKRLAHNPIPKLTFRVRQLYSHNGLFSL